MYEELLEDIAQKNGLREVNTYTKLAAGLGGILLCLLSATFVAPLFIAIALSLAILILARIDAKTYAEIFVAPVIFAVFSVSVIILLAGGETIFWSWQPLSWFSLSFTREGINEGIFVFSRVLGGTSALLFIALTTPMTDLFAVMRRARFPEEVLDLAMIIYRTIFLIMSHLVLVYRAQVMRLGYRTIRESVHSYATLCGAVFIASWESGEDLIRAMESRCYDGKFAVLGEGGPVRMRSLFAVLSFLVMSGMLVVTTRHITFL